MTLTKLHTKQINFSHTLTVEATKNVVLFNNISYKLLTATVPQICICCSFVINVILVAATCLSTSVPLFFFLTLFINGITVIGLFEETVDTCNGESPRQISHKDKILVSS